VQLVAYGSTPVRALSWTVLFVAVIEAGNWQPESLFSIVLVHEHAGATLTC
jgi:hypothetical protein